MIVLEDIHAAYIRPDREALRVLAGLNLRVDQGEFLCVLGPSGCGKTTLLNLIAGFIPPRQGRILVAGKEIHSPGPDRGVVFQDAHLFPWLSVLQNVEFGLRMQGVDARRLRQAAMTQLEGMGLRDHADAYPHALSGGMRQRVALARILVMEPSVLLLDEPFSALDIPTRERLQDELLNMWQVRRCTVVYVTHSPEEAAYLADRVLVISSDSRTRPHEEHVPLARPRDRASMDLVALESRLRVLLRTTANPFPKESV